MKKIAIHFFARLLIVSVPLVALYFFAEMAFETNRQKEHPTDVGLGIAIVLGMMLCVMFMALLIDSIYRIRRKEFGIAMTNLPFLLVFSLPILYINCKMGSYCEDCFCSWFTGLIS